VSIGRLADRLFWPLLTLAALAQAAGLVLIIAELLVLDPVHTAVFNLAAYVVLATASLTGHAVAARTALGAAAAGRRPRAIARQARRPPAQVLAVAGRLGLAGRVDCVTADQAFAVTRGLLRPRILVSSGALATLDPAELAAVLGHERAHLRRRDPLRLLAARLLADAGCYLPALRWLSHRFALHCELSPPTGLRSTTAAAPRWPVRCSSWPPHPRAPWPRPRTHRGPWTPGSRSSNTAAPTGRACGQPPPSRRLATPPCSPPPSPAASPSPARRSSPPEQADAGRAGPWRNGRLTGSRRSAGRPGGGRRCRARRGRRWRG
jgi:Peptidase family M48